MELRKNHYIPQINSTIYIEPALNGGKEKVGRMEKTESHRRNYILATLLGALGGGMVVALASRAIPKMMSEMMSGMMRNMMSQMAESGCDPAEM